MFFEMLNVAILIIYIAIQKNTEILSFFIKKLFIEGFLENNFSCKLNFSSKLIIYLISEKSIMKISVCPTLNIVFSNTKPVDLRTCIGYIIDIYVATV
uniref:Uncharacterized protein n=1 Tax=Meloidogyne enterolobii TaxID=390850 RepID=A0A6V7X3G2_MELEN|nr:unnamed protein product [Meloidogyne enterolobii]